MNLVGKIIVTIIGIGVGFWFKGCLAEILEQKNQKSNTISIYLNVVFIVWLISVLGALSEVAALSVISLIASICFYYVCAVVVIVCEDKSDSNDEWKSPKNRKVDSLLCLFLGFTGAHRFYEKKYATGVLWFLTLGFFGIGYLVDFFKVFSGLSTDKDGKAILRWR